MSARENLDDTGPNDASTNEPSLTERLEGLAAFRPIFEAPEFSFGEWSGGEGQMPWFSLSPDASHFVTTAYRLGWVVTDKVNWVSWKDTPDARRLADDPHAIMDSTVEEMEHLLTTFIRQDRFVEGQLASAFESGHLTAIARRAEAMLNELGA